MIGLVGAQAVGKTTLAQRFAEAVGVPFVATSTSAVFERLGLDPAADYPLEQRIEVQREILRALCQQYEQGARGALFFVTDRTPVDMATYMLSDVTRANCTEPVTNRAVLDYVQACIDATNRHFSTLVLVQPGIKLPPGERAGKARALPAYQEHFTHLAAGLLVDPRLHRRAIFMQRDILDLDARVQAVRNALGMTLDKHQRFVREAQPSFH